MDCGAALDSERSQIAAKLDNWERLIRAIIAEAADLNAVERSLLATRVLSIGGYQSADGPHSDTASACLAVRLAARLSEVTN